MSDLNLLPNVAKFQAAKIKVKKKVKTASIIIAGLWVLSIVIVFSVWYINQKRVELEQKRYDRAVNEFQSLKTEIVLTQQLKYKAKLVGDVMNSRFEYSYIFKLLEDLFTEKIIVEKTQIERQDAISISGRALAVSDFNEVEEKIKQIKAGLIPGFERIKINNLVLDNSGWSFSTEVNLQ